MALFGRAAWPLQQLLWRSFSTSGIATASPAAAAAGGGDTVKGHPKKKKKKNLVDVLKFLSDWGVGAKVAKKHWAPNTFYKITNVKLYEGAEHGAAWGIYHESGLPLTGKIEKIGGVNKRCWKYIDEAITHTWRKL